jgi:hypothetical protein
MGGIGPRRSNPGRGEELKVLKIEFYEEHGEWTPRHVSQGGEVQASLFELDDDKGEAELLAWFRQARVTWRRRSDVADRRAALRLVDGEC